MPGASSTATYRLRTCSMTSRHAPSTSPTAPGPRGTLRHPPPGAPSTHPTSPPEQRLPGEEPVDARTNLFAVGVIVHQLLSGGLPPSDSASLFPPDERIPIVAAGVLARLLNHNRERRYLTAAAAKKRI